MNERGTILYFKDAQEKKLKAAFNWAVEEQKLHGFISKPTRLELSGDHLEYDRTRCVAALFYDEDQKWAILRRDWPERMATTYNVVTNYNEVRRIAPTVINELLNNGVKMYDRHKAGVAY